MVEQPQNPAGTGTSHCESLWHKCMVTKYMLDWWRGEALLLDCDGVLVDSTAAIVAAWQDWCTTVDICATDVLGSIHGRRAVDTIAALLPPSDVERAVRALEAAELATASTVRAMPG